MGKMTKGAQQKSHVVCQPMGGTGITVVKEPGHHPVSLRWEQRPALAGPEGMRQTLTASSMEGTSLFHSQPSMVDGIWPVSNSLSTKWVPI